MDLILTERSRRFYDPKTRGIEKESCLLVAVETKQAERAYNSAHSSSEIRQQFTFHESLSELSELVGTAGLQVEGVCIQKLGTPNLRTYVGPGKIADIMEMANATGARTIVVDDDLTPKQQLSMETVFAQYGGGDVKILDRTALILEIFAQHARTREGQLQVELAQLQYRLTRGPSARGDASSSDIGGKNSGAGFRGPGETKLETDKRVIRDKIVLLKRELLGLDARRDQHRKSRARLGLPVVALVGYTNAGKSSVMNVLSRAGVLAENMLFATLDPTIRKVRLDQGLWERGRDPATSASPTASSSGTSGAAPVEEAEEEAAAAAAGVVDVTLGGSKKGQEVLLTDTVGFISKLPTDLIAAFRATLDEAMHADVLVHVIDRASPVWEKQRETVLRELDLLGSEVPVVELWNKVDLLPDPDAAMLEAACLPVDTEASVREWMDEEEAQTLPAPAPDQPPALPQQQGDEAEADEEDAEEEEGDDDDEEEEGFLTEAAYSQHLSSLEDSNSNSNSNGSGNSVGDSAPVLVSSSPGSDSVSDAEGSDRYYTVTARNPNGNRRVRRLPRKTFTVAASAKTGLGFDDFLSTLVDALSLRLKEVEVFVPYSQDDGLIAAIHSQGVVLELVYGDTGTRVRCRVPPALRARLVEKGFKVSKNK